MNFSSANLSRPKSTALISSLLDEDWKKNSGMFPDSTHVHSTSNTFVGSTRAPFSTKSLEYNHQPTAFYSAGFILHHQSLKEEGG